MAMVQGLCACACVRVCVCVCVRGLKPHLARANRGGGLQIPTAQATNQTAWTASGTSSGLPQGVGSSLCNNEPNQPCGSEATYGSSPLAFIKLQVQNGSSNLAIPACLPSVMHCLISYT